VKSKPDLDSMEELQALKAVVRSRLTGLERLELRYSGTEPLFRAMIEASHAHTEQELANTAWELCRAVQNASGLEGTGEDKIEILNVTRGGLMSNETPA
jgi:phosphomannomutase